MLRYGPNLYNSMHILGISGSLRKASYNTALLRYALSQLPEGVTHEVADIGSLPLMNQDLEVDMPAPVTAFKKALERADAVLITSPEYNYSVPGVLKNAIDWASRPYGQTSWKGKVVAIMGASSGGFGTVRMQPELRYILASQPTHTLYHPEVQISKAQEKINMEGEVTDEETRKKIQELVDTLINETKKRK